MLLSEVRDILDAKILTDDMPLDADVHSACGCDLMSDVLAFVKDQALLLTGLTNLQVIRTAEMMDIRAVVFVRGKTPEQSIIELAREHDLMLMTTEYPLYAACGMLYEKGLPGRGRKQHE